MSHLDGVRSQVHATNPLVDGCRKHMSQVSTSQATGGPGCVLDPTRPATPCTTWITPATLSYVSCTWFNNELVQMHPPAGCTVRQGHEGHITNQYLSQCLQLHHGLLFCLMFVHWLQLLAGEWDVVARFDSWDELTEVSPNTILSLTLKSNPKLCSICSS